MRPVEGGRPDNIYKEKLAKIADFEFDEQVTAVFDDMVRRSVPGYELVVDLIGVIGAFVEKELNRPILVYDLGCSKGAVSKSLLHNLTAPSSAIVAVDNSADMVEAASATIKDQRVVFQHADIRDIHVKDADIVVMNLVLQFLEPDQRLRVLSGIRQGLRKDGLLILTEKVQTTTQDVLIHEQFKQSKGYSKLEIQQKREALERVMQIDTLDTHQKRLTAAGFKQINVWFKLLNWISLIARC